MPEEDKAAPHLDSTWKRTLAALLIVLVLAGLAIGRIYTPATPTSANPGENGMQGGDGQTGGAAAEDGLALTAVTSPAHYATILQEAEKSGEIVLVDFWATWCGPCHMQKDIFKKMAATLPQDVKIVTVNVDQQRDLAMQYRVQSIPTMLLFKDGVEVKRMVGVQEKDTLLDAFSRARNIM